MSSTDDWRRAGFEVKGDRLERIENDYTHDKGNDDPEFQKQQAMAHKASERQTAGTPLFDNRPESAEVDGSNHGQFRVTASFRFSDRRRRDSHGAYETVIDCLVAATRRLLDADTQNTNKRRTVRAGQRRRNSNNRAPVIEGPVPF